MKVIIVGGVAGGASAAARLRRIDEGAEIIMFEKGEYISFANCGLPYYIGGVIKEKEKLLVQTPEAMKKRFNIDVRVQSEVVKINQSEKTVTVLSHKDKKEYNESYDKLVLSPGAEPILPKIDGIDFENVFTLRNIPDTYKIKNYVDSKNPKTAVVVGGGYIGVEMAENLHLKGIDVTLVEFADQIISQLDYEMATVIHSYLRNKGIKLILKNALTKIEKSENNLCLTLNDSTKIETEMVVLGIGVRPESKIAVEAGIKTAPNGGIIVDNNFKTSLDDIYAVGDAIEVKRFVGEKGASIPLAGPANKQGRAVADVLAGRNIDEQKVQGASVLKVFDMTVATVGMNEKLLKNDNIKYEKTYIHPLNHAGYYPGGSQLTMKMLFSKEDGKIYGAQAIGFDGVEKRIDVLATAQRLGATVFDLEKLELCYAPPYSSAKDPVNMLGFTAANIIKGDTKVFHFDEIDNLNLDEAILLDVRTKQEYSLGTIKNAINIPVDDLRERLSELPKDKIIYLFCQVGLRGYLATRILMQNGFNEVYNLSGGYKLYNAVINEQTPQMPCDCLGNSKEAEEKECNMDILKIDATGLQCPGPILKVSEALKKLPNGSMIEVVASDPAFGSDISVWCEKTGNILEELKTEGSNIIANIVKGEANSACNVNYGVGNDKTMVVFSGDLDKAIASFIIANGAAAMGRKVTMFFTFWGLNILRKPKRVKVKKDIISRMFGMMMPRGSKRLSLSKMNMGGIGAKMIRMVMKNKNVQSLEELIELAISSGIRVVACQMSMDVMGIKKDELIDGVEIGGVATFLGSAESSDTNLFI